MENNRAETFHRKLAVTQAAAACDLLALSLKLSKARIKDAMAKGAVWLHRRGGKEKRIRKATFSLLPNDRVEVYYDPDLLRLSPPPPCLVADMEHYSIWNKPANLLTQGTRYGDHCSLIRCVEIYFRNRRKVFPVHRLDRETAGLVLLAHSRKSASAFSDLFRQGDMEKRYHAKVYGLPAPLNTSITITQPLDGKKAVTEITVIDHSDETNTSDLDIRLHTGRLHQIRRHLQHIGHPVVGDPRYGIAVKTEKIPLQLQAYSLGFKCPFSGTYKTFTLRQESDLPA